MDSTIEISIVSPVYRAEGCVEELISRTSDVLQEMSVAYEIILVNDSSPDQSWERIVECTDKFAGVKGVNLSRNFGQHQAIFAGLSHARGKAIIVMDCDLQDVPEEIPKLYDEYRKGNHVVLAQRAVRTDGWSKRISSKWFYRLFGYLTDSTQDPSVANFGVYDRKVIDALLAMKDRFKYLPAMAQWAGFRTSKVPVRHAPRHEGESSYNLRKLVRLALSVVLSFSDKPLRLVVRLGLVFSMFSLGLSLYYLIKYFAGDIVVMGYASLIISIWFLSGIIITILGMVGLYIGRIFDQVKLRPEFVVMEEVNSPDLYPNLTVENDDSTLELGY